MPIYAIGERSPEIDPSAFVHPDAVIIGDVRIGPESSIWPTTVLRGDIGSIRIGAQTSVQDGSVLHCTPAHATIVGDRCVVGHRVHLEGCIIEDDSLIGSGSIVLNGAVVGTNALVGAGALVTGGVVVPPNARALGVPARITEAAVEEGTFTRNVQTYVRNAHWYNAELRRIG